MKCTKSTNLINSTSRSKKHQNTFSCSVTTCKKLLFSAFLVGLPRFTEETDYKTLLALLKSTNLMEQLRVSYIIYTAEKTSIQQTLCPIHQREVQLNWISSRRQSQMGSSTQSLAISQWVINTSKKSDSNKMQRGFSARSPQAWHRKVGSWNKIILVVN